MTKLRLGIADYTSSLLRLPVVIVRASIPVLLSILSRVLGQVRLAGVELTLGLCAAACAADVTAAQVQELLEQNRRLQEQVRSQQQTIDGLNVKMADVLKASERHERELRGL